MLEKVKAAILQLTDKKHLWIGYSGGMDSHVLLDLVVQAFKNHPTFKVSAIHVHHGINVHADQWVQHCETICADLHVPLSVLWVDAKATQGESPEAMAREARFAAFEQFLEIEHCLLLAHHEGDQAETILLRLFRGTGPLGLGGIKEKGSLGKSELIRPLLQVPKAEVVEYAHARNLQWIEDDSNLDSRFDRNFLRHEIMPIINARWPRVVRSINRAGALCLETATAVQVLALQDIEIVQRKANNNLIVSKLLQLEPIRRRQVLRYWLQQAGLLLPSRDHMERIDREVLRAKPGSKPRLKISDYEIYRLKGELGVKIFK